MIPDEFEARDIFLAAYLDAMGVPFVRAVPIDDRRCRFVFDNQADKAHELALEWREGIDAQVCGPAFVASYRRLVRLSHAATFGEGTYRDQRSA